MRAVISSQAMPLTVTVATEVTTELARRSCLGCENFVDSGGSVACEADVPAKTALEAEGNFAKRVACKSCEYRR